MEELVVFAVLLSIVVLAGSVCGLLALSKVNALQHQLNTLKNQLLTRHSAASETTTTTATTSPTTDELSDNNSNLEAALASKPAEPNAHIPITSQTPIDTHVPEEANTPPITTSIAEPNPAQPAASDNSRLQQSNPLIQQFKDNWLIWVGGLALAFGGVFLVNYLLEAGLLSVGMRLLLGALFGIALIAAAEYLHYKNVPFEGFANYVPAALAGSGFISLFALTLLALMSFKLLGAHTAFVLLALIALSAAWYALRFGPILAVLGILGAYSVPLWISSEQPQWSLLLSYVALVSLAATLVAKQVQRQWLWYLLWAAHLGWLALVISAQLDANEQYLAIALFALFSLWLLIVVPRTGWRFKLLSQQSPELLSILKLQPDNALFIGIFILLIGFLGLASAPLTLSHYSTFILIICVPLLLAPLRFSHWDSWPFFSFALLALLLFQQDMPIGYDEQFMAFSEVLGMALVFALLLFVYGLYFAYKLPHRLSFAVLASMVFFVVIALSYANNNVQAIDSMYPIWCVILLTSAAILIAFAQRSDNLMQQFCYWSGSNANLAFVFTLILDKTALTLALVIQIVLMSWLIRRYRIPAPHWPIKLLVVAVLLRLTFAPWQAEYQDFAIFSLHWSTLIYPLVIALFVLSSYLWQVKPSMQLWLKGALLHLIALFVTTQTSLYLVGHVPDFAQLNVYEQIVLSMNWLLLSCVYLYRQQMAHKLAPLYRLAAIVLLVGAAVLQLRLSVQYNPFFTSVFVGNSVVFSWLWLWWGVPALAALWISTKHHLLDENIKLPALIASGVFAWLLINGLIRQFWQGQSIHLENLTPAAELYSYSIIWLIIGALIVIMSHLKQHSLGQRIGLTLLALVIAKVFLIDMANLEGLLRAVSFIGLGLCLVALSWLFQWLRKQSTVEH